MKTTLLFLSVFLSVSLFGQNVYIPDANFKAYLVGNPEINTNGDSEIQISEASSYGGAINCEHNVLISDLTGIEAFTSLTVLNCYDNALTSLDLSKNIALKKLNCNTNKLISINVSKNTELIELVVMFNDLKSLDVSSNVALTELSCDFNQLTKLDVSMNTSLEYLSCDENQFSCVHGVPKKCKMEGAEPCD